MSSSVPAGTLTQLAGQGARLVASPRRRVFPGHPDQVRQARRFVARALDGCPAADDAVLGVSELASNAVQHTRSGQGGRFQVLVWRGRASACAAVIDDGAGPAGPHPGRMVREGWPSPVTACASSPDWRPAGGTRTSLPSAYPAAPSGFTWPGLMTGQMRADPAAAGGRPSECLRIGPCPDRAIDAIMDC